MHIQCIFELRPDIFPYNDCYSYKLFQEILGELLDNFRYQ